MRRKTYFLACSTVFFVVASAYLTRLIIKWEIAIAGWTVPQGGSVPGLIISGVLPDWGFAFASRNRATA